MTILAEKIPLYAVLGGSIGYGRLVASPGPHPPLAGWPIDWRRFPTRWAEYGFILETLAAVEWEGPILDAGSGINEEIHRMPVILASSGMTPVIAVDHNPVSLDLPSPDGVSRVLGDITKLDHLASDSVGVYCSVSVLEHLSEDERRAAWREAYRVVKPGGYLLVTMDTHDPEILAADARSVGFLTGDHLPIDGTDLTPAVAWLRGHK